MTPGEDLHQQPMFGHLGSPAVWGSRQCQRMVKCSGYLGLNRDSHTTSWVTLEKLVNSFVPPFPNGVSFRGCENKVGYYV